MERGARAGELRTSHGSVRARAAAPDASFAFARFENSCSYTSITLIYPVPSRESHAATFTPAWLSLRPLSFLVSRQSSLVPTPDHDSYPDPARRRQDSTPPAMSDSSAPEVKLAEPATAAPAVGEPQAAPAPAPAPAEQPEREREPEPESEPARTREPSAEARQEVRSRS